MYVNPEDVNPELMLTETGQEQGKQKKQKHVLPTQHKQESEAKQWHCYTSIMVAWYRAQVAGTGHCTPSICPLTEWAGHCLDDQLSVNLISFCTSSNPYWTCCGK